jgi:hypothetical protein
MTGFEGTSVISRLLLGAVLVCSLTSVACLTDFNDGKTKNMIEAAPVKLDAEQVTLTRGEIDCGIQTELWGPPSPPNQGRSLCPLTAAGRALKFDDDIVFTEPGYHSSYVQVRGAFPLGVISIENTKDGKEQDTKLVELKVGVKIDNACFPNPLPIMGLRKGQFSQDYNPVMLFRLDGGWQLDRLVH